MSEFSQRVANRLKRQQHPQEGGGPDADLEQRRKEERGPEIWKALRSEIKAACEEVNRDYASRALFFDECPHDEVRVELRHNGEMRSIDGRFTAVTGLVHWKTTGRYNSHGEYPLHVHKDGSVDFYGAGDGSPRAIAEKMILELTRD